MSFYTSFYSDTYCQFIRQYVLDEFLYSISIISDLIIIILFMRSPQGDS